MGIFWKIFALLVLICLKFSSCQKQLVPLINSNYNQACTSPSQCNNNAGLYCVPIPSGQQRCRCPTNSTTFDEYQGRCVGKVGHPCVYQGNQSFCPDKAHCTHQDPHHTDLYFYESRCFCDVNYFANKDGKCILAAKYEENCHSSAKKCDQVSGLVCVQGKCACNFGKDHQYYDTKKDKCVSYLGRSCSGFNSCPENARCDSLSINRVKLNDETRNNRVNRQVPTPPAIFGRSINSGAIQTSRFNVPNLRQSRPENETKVNINIGNCICEYGFSTTKDGKCLAGYRQSCSRLQRCNHEDNLECLDGSCNCKSPLQQVYDHSTKKCVNLVGSKCNSAISNSFIENSICLNGFVECKQGFSKTPFRYCMLSHNMECENGRCNMHNGLGCITTFNATSPNNGIKSGKKCSCVDDSLVYHQELGKCLAKFDSPCGTISQAGEFGKETFYISCEPPAICREEPGGDKNSKFCRVPFKDL